jgi:hypothetical protein
MKQLKIAILTMAMAISGIAHAATDGTLGSVSSGTFVASATASPPVGTQVIVSGLEDLLFAPVIVQNSGSSGAQTVIRPFCIARSTQGDVNVKVSQTGINDGKAFNLNLGGAGPEFIPVTGFSVIQLTGEANNNFPLSNSGASFTMHNPPTSCPQPTTVARISMTIPTIVGTEFGGAGGNFSGQFTLLVSPL